MRKPEELARAISPLWCFFHENTKHPGWAIQNVKAHQTHYEDYVQELVAAGPKTYSTASQVPLPLRYGVGVRTGLQEVISRRRSRRHLGGTLTIVELATILRLSHGVMSGVRASTNRIFQRAVPSSGNLGSVHVYIIAKSVRGIAPGIYYYDSRSHGLVPLREGDYSDELARTILFQKEFASAPALLCFSALIGRVAAKYGDRAYRLAHLDVGHVGQMVYLLCTSMGLGCCAMGGFIDDAMNRLLEVDGEKEAVLHLMAVGRVGRS